VNEHFARRPAWPDSELALPRGLRSRPGPLSYEPEHARVSGYFNLDNGSGKIRGIYLEENAALRPIFERGSRHSRISGSRRSRSTDRGTDHVPSTGRAFRVSSSSRTR